MAVKPSCCGKRGVPAVRSKILIEVIVRNVSTSEKIMDVNFPLNRNTKVKS